MNDAAAPGPQNPPHATVSATSSQPEANIIADYISELQPAAEIFLTHFNIPSDMLRVKGVTLLK